MTELSGDDTTIGDPPELPPEESSMTDGELAEAEALAGTLQPSDRRTLQHGVDSLRCSGLHGLDINLTMKLAKTFQSLGLESEEVTDGDQSAGAIVKELNTRAGLYYSASLAGLERLERGAAVRRASERAVVREPSVRLLQPAGNTPTILEMEKMKENANFFLACQKMRDGLHEEAIASFKEQKSPHASFYTGKIYQKLAMEEASETGLECGGRMRELLVESRESFYLTLDRLRGQGAGGHPLDSQLSECLEEVESLLNSQGSNGVEAGEGGTALGTPPRRGDPLGARRILSQLTSTPQSHRSIFDGNVSGMRSEARPSPERLDVQMRHLTGELSKTNTELAKTVASVGDSMEASKAVSAVKEVVETNNRILGEIKDNLRKKQRPQNCQD